MYQNMLQDLGSCSSQILVQNVHLNRAQTLLNQKLYICYGVVKGRARVASISDIHRPFIDFDSRAVGLCGEAGGGAARWGSQESLYNVYIVYKR